MLSRFDNDTYKGNKEELSLVDLVGEQVEAVKVIDDNIKVEFENSLEDGGMIISDRKLLIRIIQNLLSNAIKYANSKVKIVAHTVRDDENVAHTVRDDENVGVSEDVGASSASPRTGELCEPHYTISVIDDGNGIDSSNLENIFTRHYKGEDGHFGIGLAVVKSSVDYLSGKISVESKIGKGTKFVVEL